jgi:hypothetical protein
MGWKTINGRRYYYKSERDGGRVKTTYFGARESGLLISLLELEDRAEREAELEARRAEREESDAEDRAVSSWFDDVQAVADAAIVAAGFHKHKGQWRRKRR